MSQVLLEAVNTRMNMSLQVPRKSKKAHGYQSNDSTIK